MATITGTGGNDAIAGTADADTITAGAGNDTVDGGRGRDHIIVALSNGPLADDAVTATGGAGRDTYVFDSGAGARGLTVTDFTAGAGGDLIDVRNLRWYSLGFGYEDGNPLFHGTGFLRLVQSGADTLLQYDEDGAGTLHAWHTAATLLNVDASTLRVENFLGAAPDGNGVAGQVRSGTAADDLLRGGFFDDTLRGGEGADMLIGGGGDDWIEGGDEVDRGDQIEGGPGDDTLFGGAGDDVIGDFAGNDIMRGGAGDDDIYVYALEGSVFVRVGGGGGNDLIDVNMNGRDGPQAVEAHGGKGDDDFRVYAAMLDGSASLLATGGAGQDTYLFWYSGAAGGLAVTDFQTGDGGDRIDVDTLLHSPVSQGNRYDGGNPFDAERGCLRLVQDGANTLLQYDLDGVAGATHDWYTAAVLLGVDVGALTAHNFVGIPPDGSPIAGERRFAPDHSSQIEGWLGDDTLRGGSGNDQLRGAPGADLLVGGGGDDSLSGNLGDDTLYGGAGNDSLAAEQGDNRVHGGAGDDTLWCVGHGDGIFVGGAGADRVFLSLNSNAELLSVRARGGDGNDIFRVGLDYGSSVLATGGAGRDTYSIAERTLSGDLSTRLTVTDFEAGTGGDSIRLSSIDADPSTDENDAFTFIGTGTFSTTDATGQVRYAFDTLTGIGMLYGSTDTDTEAEFAIALTGVADLAAANLTL